MFRTEKTSKKEDGTESERERAKENVTSMHTHQRLIFKLERWMRISYRIRQGGRSALETVVFRRSLDGERDIDGNEEHYLL